MALMRSTIAGVVAVLATVASNTAIAQAPRCSGSDAATQARSRTEGLRRYRTAIARDPVNRVEMAAALEAFEAQCLAGDINALEMRAYALAGLGRYVDAAESLDAFLEARPLHTLDEGTRERVATQFAVIQTRIATLSLEGNVADSSVMVNGRGYGTLPRANIRLAPGEIAVQVFAPSIGAVRRVFTMRPGETRRELFEPGSASSGSTSASGTSTSGTSASNANTSGSSGASATSASQSNSASSGNNGNGETGSAGSSASGGGPVDGPTPEPRRARGAPIVPIALGVGAIAVAGGFVGATVWYGGRVAELSKPECTNPTDPDIVSACRAVAGERDAVFATQITTGVVAGGLLIGAGVTLGLWFASAPRASSAQSAAPYCAPQVGAQHGVICGARF
ncbi:MAG: hypothetical protein U0269_10615 [Polyangiales bacterium]